MAGISFSDIFCILLESLSNVGRKFNQTDVFSYLFQSFFTHNKIYSDIDKSTITKIKNGKRAVHQEIQAYCLECRGSVSNDFKNNILDFIANTHSFKEKLKELIDANIEDERQKELLYRNYEKDLSNFFEDLVIFSFNNTLTSSQCSPLLSNVMHLPKYTLTTFFSGREKELSALNEMLKAHNVIYIEGIGGIGKSEFAKKYISLHNKDFTNILYLSYSVSIKNTIASLRFKNDDPKDSIENLYRSHINVLRSLKSDSLIIIDNFDIMPDTDENLRDILEFDCKVIFTTRNHFGDEYTTFPLVELDENDLFHIAKEMNINETADTLSRLFDAVHRHTLSGELILRLLKRSAYTADELIEHLHNDHIKLSLTDNIRLSPTKSPASYYEHLRLLFNLISLSEELQATLRILSLIPSMGIKDRYLKVLTKSENLNNIYELDEIGLIRYSNHNISIHPLIAEIAAAELMPDMNNCRAFFDSIISEASIVIEDRTNIVRRLVILPIADNIIEFTVKNDTCFYIYFLNSICTYAESFVDVYHMKKYIAEVDRYIYDNSPESLRAVQYMNKAAYEKLARNDNSAAIKLTLKAAELILDLLNDDNNAVLVFNIYNNLLRFYMDRNDIPRAIKYGNMAEKILQKHQIKNNDTIIFLYNMSELYFKKKDYPNAIFYINEVLQIYSLAAPESLDYANALLFAAKIHRAAGNEDMAQYYVYCANRILGVLRIV